MMLTITQAAAYLGVTDDTLRNWHKSGKLIPHIQEGRKVYAVADLERVSSEKHSYGDYLRKKIKREKKTT